MKNLNESASKLAMGIAGLTGTRGDAVQKFIDEYVLDAKQLFNFLNSHIRTVHKLHTPVWQTLCLYCVYEIRYPIFCFNTL